MSEPKRDYAYYCRECEAYVEAIEKRKCWGRYCPNGCEESCVLIPDVRSAESQLAAALAKVAELEAELRIAWEPDLRVAELEQELADVHALDTWAEQHEEAQPPTPVFHCYLSGDNRWTLAGAVLPGFTGQRWVTASLARRAAVEYLKKEGKDE